MEPCVALDPRQRALCRDVMRESHETATALEFSVPKPDLLSYLDCEEEATAVDLHISRDTPAAECGAGAGQEEPAEEKPSTDTDHAQLPASPGEPHAANSECGEIFSHEPALVQHRETHSSDRPHASPDCGQGFIQRPDLAAHRCAHTGRQPHGSSLLLHRRWHQQGHPGGKPFECSECGKAFAWSSHLERHRRVHTGEKPFECSECGRAFAWSFHLDRHVRTHVTIRVTTRVTTRVAAGDEEGAQAAQEPPPAPQKCADCGKSLSHRTDPRRFKHKATQTPLAGTDPAPRPHRCEQCGKCFGSSSGLLKHRCVHGSKRLHPCPHCPRRFRRGTALAKHQRSHAQPPSDAGSAGPAAEGAAKRHPCGACGKSFGWLSHLERHRRVHTGEKPFCCGECGRGFATSSHLQRHRRVHAGKRPFRRDRCGKSFAASPVQRRSHGTQPGQTHACPECGKGFGSLAGLGQHRRLHRGEKPFQCGLCGEGFSWSSGCDQQQLTHTGEKPFPCAHCSHRSPPEGRRVCPDSGRAFGASSCSPPALLPPAWWEGEARAGTGTSPELRPEEPSSAEGDSLQGNATAPTEPWLSPPPPVS